MRENRLTIYDEKKQRYRLVAKSCCGGPDFDTAIQKLGLYEDGLPTLDLKFKIGDKVKVLKPHSGIYCNVEPFEAIIGGYIINKTENSTKIYYTLSGSFYNSAISDYNRKKRYFASELEKIKE